ncbi:MAG: hypothetical protein HQL65_14605 [Magnetococcales bacterium]|nr:hypothetical protein [Magnetococcales bacterium]
MKNLGDVTLPDSLQWTDRWEWSPVAQEATRTLGGTVVTWSQALSGGRPITLDATEEATWLDQSTVEAIRAMATQAGTTFPLVWDSETFTVMFRHHDAPAASFKLVFPHLPETVRFTGTIKLMTI